MVQRLLLFALACLAASQARAQSSPEAGPRPAAEPRPFFSRISGLFSGDLPQLDPPGTVKIILRPHFGDLIHRDYMRVETGLRWALNDRFELSSEASVFFNHGLGDPADNGIGKIRFGSKYIFESWPRGDFETSVGLNVDVPVGHPPIDLTDGRRHVSPTVVIQHHSDRNPRLATYAGMGLDLLSQSSIAGTFATNQPHDDSFSVTVGGIYDAGQLKWTLSGTYASTALLGDRTDHFLYVQPGVLWYVPARFTFNSKTQWIVALGARTTWGPDGFDMGLRSRLRAEITLRQVMAKMRIRLP